MRVLQLRPGITDWASIWNADEGSVLAGSGDPDQLYERIIRPTKVRLQLMYCDQSSLWVDLKILCYTLIKLTQKDWLPPELDGFEPLAAPGWARAQP
jgi:lipopolysaccharide/colanic/teichoic acid biosynthesis glycosyltransferase